MDYGVAQCRTLRLTCDAHRGDLLIGKTSKVTHVSQNSIQAESAEQLRVNGLDQEPSTGRAGN